MLSFEQSSTRSPFGETNSVFGPNNSSNNPFSPKPFGSTTPFGSQTDSSISGGASTGAFGAFEQSSTRIPIGQTKSVLGKPFYGLGRIIQVTILFPLNHLVVQLHLVRKRILPYLGVLPPELLELLRSHQQDTEEFKKK